MIRALSRHRSFSRAQSLAQLDELLGGEPTDTGDAFEPAVSALQALAEGPSRAFICEAGFLPPIVGLLRDGAATDAVQEHAARILVKLTAQAATRDAVAAIPGAIHSLVRLLREGVQSPLAQAAAEVLRNLAISPAMKDSLREAGVLEPLIDLLATAASEQGSSSAGASGGSLGDGKGDATGARWCIGIVRNLATSSINQDSLRKAGAIPILVDFLGSGDPAVSSRAAAAISNLAVNNSVVRPRGKRICARRRGGVMAARPRL